MLLNLYDVELPEDPVDLVAHLVELRFECIGQLRDVCGGEGHF